MAGATTGLYNCTRRVRMCLKCLFICVWLVSYTFIGEQLQMYNTITCPAYWSLYGAFFGIVGYAIYNRINTCGTLS